MNCGSFEQKTLFSKNDCVPMEYLPRMKIQLPEQMPYSNGNRRLPNPQNGALAYPKKTNGKIVFTLALPVWLKSLMMYVRL